MALVFVVVIAALLVAIALPFAFSMGQQEKGARGSVDRVHARFAAAAARNRAVAAVVPGWEGLEERPTSPVPFNTPFYDTAREFSSGRAGRLMAPGFGTGALVADEQGKINVRTAPKLVVDNLLKRIDPRVDDVRDYLTEANGRPADWIEPQTLRWVEPYGKRLGVVLFAVDHWGHLSPGTRVRVSNGKESRIGEVVQLEEDQLGLTGVADTAEVDSLLEIEQRHALNINTASREALAATFEGLAFRDMLDKDRVTRQEADDLAAAMVKRTFEDWGDFHRFLAMQVELRTITDADYGAILVNRDWPSAWILASTGTVPLTLQSWNYVTVAARGVVERPNRAVGGECDLREIVEAAPAGTLPWRCQSQEDFQRVLVRGMARGIFTGPAFPGEREFRERTRGAWFTGVTGQDTRNSWPMAVHFRPHNEGKELGDGLTFAGAGPYHTGQVVCWPSGATEFWFQAPDTDATLFEGGEDEWSNRIILTYEGTGDTAGPFLRLRVKDATFEKGFSQVVHRVRLTPKRWYHVGGFWKSTRNGGMMMTLDGLPVGEWRAVLEGPAQQAGKELGSPMRLSSPLTKSTTSVDVDVPVDDLPSPGAIAIGGEVIEYQAAAGKSFKGVTRGARGSIAWEHQSGETVAPWGYTDHVVETTVDFRTAGFSGPVLHWDRISQCAGALRYRIGSVPESRTAVAGKSPPDPRDVGLGQGETVFSVPTGTAAGFPEEGWLLVGNAPREIIRYAGHDDSRFTGLRRGQFGTPDRDHFVMEPVELNGFLVSTNDGFNDPTVLCIEGEFFGPVQKVGTDGWIAFVGTAAAGGPEPWTLLRGPAWDPASAGAAHAAGTGVFPTFALEDAKAGRGDRITIVQKDYGMREEARIAGATWVEGARTDYSPPALCSPLTLVEWPFLLAGLAAPARWEVVSDRPFNRKLPSSWGRFNIRRYSRVLKFPSGELPYAPPAPLSVGASGFDTEPRELGGWVDELRAATAEYTHWCVAIPLDSVESDCLQFGVKLPNDHCAPPPPPVVGPPPVPTDPGPVAPPPVEPPEPTEEPVIYTPLDPLGGAVLVDDEVIGYEEFDVSGFRLKGLKRGYLGTTPRPHGKCSQVFPLTYLAIAVLQKGIAADGRKFGAGGAGGFPGEGYFLVDREIVGWSRVGTDLLWMPAGCSFRGAFGTTPDTHAEGSLLYAMPWRFFDRFTVASDDSDLHWFEGTLRATGARWKSVRWEEMFGGSSVDVRTFVKFSTSPRWIEYSPVAPAGKKDARPKFFGFDDSKGGSLGGTMADQVNVRVMFEFTDGAYARDQWKECPQVRGFTVEYEQDNVVHRHEER